MQVESIKGTIRSVTADLVSNVVLYDEDFFPDDRKAFIRNWILEEETVAVVMLDNEYSSKVLGKNYKNITCRILLLNYFEYNQCCQYPTIYYLYVSQDTVALDHRNPTAFGSLDLCLQRNTNLLV